FSSRRRHTRFSRDWSSDVCSSDLEQRLSLKLQPEFNFEELSKAIDADEIWNAEVPRAYKRSTVIRELKSDDEIAKEWGMAARGRSEERRVGKECRAAAGRRGCTKA